MNIEQTEQQEITQRILKQRAARYTDAGPALAPTGTARFRLESGRMSLGYASAQPGQERELVARVAQYARAKQLQVQWAVVPERSGEAELAPALQEAGFTCTEDMFLMAHTGGIAPSDHPEVAIQPMMNWQMMFVYEYGSRQCFYNDPYPAEAMVQQRATERWREQQHGWYRYYAALVGGQVVGGCYISLFEDIPTIMGVYTLPAMRKRGVATRLLTHVVNDAVGLERQVCCLFVERTNPAKDLYTSLGFFPLVASMTYILNQR